MSPIIHLIQGLLSVLLHGFKLGRVGDIGPFHCPIARSFKIMSCPNCHRPILAETGRLPSRWMNLSCGGGCPSRSSRSSGPTSLSLACRLVALMQIIRPFDENVFVSCSFAAWTQLFEELIPPTSEASSCNVSEIASRLWTDESVC